MFWLVEAFVMAYFDVILRFLFNGAPTMVKKARRKTLVLDLDETLIHSSIHSKKCDFRIEKLGRTAVIYHVLKRPHLDYFLHKVSQWFRIVIFTASVSEYADPIIDRLGNSSSTKMHARYYRDSCVGTSDGLGKDLQLIEKDLANVILIDNTPSCFVNKDNAILINSWTYDASDEALLDLLPFLDALRFTKDVRSVLSLHSIKR